MFLSASTIIQTTACHTCCAMRGEPCLFNRTDDPEGKRHAARDSHLDRKSRAMSNICQINILPVDKTAVSCQDQST
jgi:hypothetical protein